MSCVLFMSCTQSSPLEGVWQSEESRLHVYTEDGITGFMLQHDFRNEYGRVDIGGLKYKNDSTADLFFGDGSVLNLKFIKDKGESERYHFFTNIGAEDGLKWERLKSADAYKQDEEEKAIRAAIIAVTQTSDKIKDNL